MCTWRRTSGSQLYFVFDSHSRRDRPGGTDLHDDAQRGAVADTRGAECGSSAARSYLVESRIL